MKKTKTIGCEEALKHLLAYLDQELGSAKRRELEQHIEICRSCFSRAEFEKLLKTQLREAGREMVGASLEKRIKTLLGRF
ncbi:MAG: zf-HC2 domain-containing protein [Nitrospirae bacterium]|nr:zf-HC2 domain-containing protein [Nitrospirota bacterium]